MKKIFICLLFILFICAGGYAQIKKADLAGEWYYDSKEKLTAMLESYLEKADPPQIKGEIIALISPHAGFAASGSVAAYGFKAVRDRDIETVIVIGFSHPVATGDIAVLNAEAFQTPLGRIKINKELTEALIKQHKKIRDYPRAFFKENSVEMIIPFVQVVFKDADMVLIAIGEQDYKNVEILGNAVEGILKDKKKYLLVGSTDLSHRLPYDEAARVDGKTISAMEKLDPKLLYTESLLNRHMLMCGYGAVCATIEAAKKLGATDIGILKYANSGDTIGGRREVVGYVSAAIIKANGPDSGSREEAEEGMLNKEQRKKLLKIARESIETYLSERKIITPEADDPALEKEMGAFVTLNNKSELRGCIGNFVGSGPLYLTVRDMAIAATKDGRFIFNPVTLSEMKNIDIEISVLSPMRLIKDPEAIEIGKHGVYVKQGFTTGVYLPQVAIDMGWDREEFMNSLCGHKAGMDPYAWKKGTCEIYIFDVEYFGEKDE